MVCTCKALRTLLRPALRAPLYTCVRVRVSMRKPRSEHFHMCDKNETTLVAPSRRNHCITRTPPVYSADPGVHLLGERTRSLAADFRPDASGSGTALTQRAIHTLIAAGPPEPMGSPKPMGIHHTP